MEDQEDSRQAGGWGGRDEILCDSQMMWDFG